VQQIRERNLENLVHFSGWVEESSTFFQNIDVFVLASQHDEGYGLVVAEAMVNKKPVVITKSGGAVEIVQDGICGYVVPKGSVDEMAEKLKELSLNPSLCKQMGDKGYERIKAEFDIVRQARQLAELLSEIK
jgi:glycosyltransferase involved in cell wall biosynthesis